MRAENGSNFRTQYKSIQNFQTALQGYIFRILQHFATKRCNFTHHSMLFLVVVIYLHLLAYSFEISLLMRIVLFSVKFSVFL
jgi:hypothetical protein